MDVWGGSWGASWGNSWLFGSQEVTEKFIKRIHTGVSVYRIKKLIEEKRVKPVIIETHVIPEIIMEPDTSLEDFIQLIELLENDE